ncbi:MAG: PAS domain S-box protein [Candidatus Zixiibacteriota bacterium]
MTKLSSSDIQRRIVIFILIVGFCGIAIIDYYSRLQTKGLTRKNLEAMIVLKSFNRLETAIHETLTSTDLDKAQNNLARATDQFSQDFSGFSTSRIIKELAVDNPEFRDMMNNSDSLWQSLRARLDNLQLRLGMYLANRGSIEEDKKHGLLIDVGFHMRNRELSDEFVELKELTDDISFIVSVLSDRFSTLLAGTIDRLSRDIDDKVYMLSLVSLLLSVTIILVMVFYVGRIQNMFISSEQRYHSLHDNISVGVFRTKPDGTILSANPYLAEIFNEESADNFIGRSTSEFYVDMADRLRFLDLMKKNNRVDNMVVQLKHCDNAPIWVSISSKVVNDKNGMPIYFDGIMENISERKKTQEELLHTKQELEQILQMSPAVIYRCGAGPIYPTLYISDNVRHQFGYTAEDFYRDELLWTKMIHPDDRDTTLALLDKIDSGHTVNHQYRLSHKNGTYVWIIDILTPIIDTHGTVSGIIGSWLNITEQKKAEEALQKSEATLQSLLTAAPVGIGLMHNRKISWVSDKMLAMTGFSRNELIGESARILYADEDEFDRVGDVKYRQIHATGSGSLDTKWKTKAGEMIDILLCSTALDPNDISAGVIFSALDITDRIIAQNALKESEERFRAIFESAQDAIFIKDRECRYVSVNPAMSQLFEISRDKLINKFDRDIFSAADSEKINRSDLRVLQGDIINDEESLSVHGKTLTFHIIKVPMRNSAGVIIGLCGIARNVTEMKKLQSVAARAERLETAGRIAGQVAHDFNNLLGPLVAYPTFIKDELPDGHIALQFVNDMEAAAEQMAEINQQLLTLGRRGHYNQEPVQLNRLIEQSLTHLPPHPDTISVKPQLAPDLRMVKGGAAQLSRVIFNLITNAIDALGDIGTITIATENFANTTEIGKYNRIPPGEYIRMTISDNGTGITADILPKIFDPFFTTKKTDRKRGSGLGLSVVHSVINDHQGFVDIESAPGAGTSIFVYIPATSETSIRHPLQDIAGGSEKVLIVDDDEVQREVSTKILQKLGYTTFAAESGEKALEFLAEQKPDLIILDMIMPEGIDGTTTFERAKQLYPDIKAIIVSGYSESDRVDQALKAGARAFVKKPLTMEMLAAAVRKALE